MFQIKRDINKCFIIIIMIIMNNNYYNDNDSNYDYN